MAYDQNIASDPNISVWVSASAGTGKTKVLTDRVLRLLLAGSKPSKILCITYTKAAAAEMEHRIETQLGNWAIAGDQELNDTISALTGKTPGPETIKRARQLFAIVLDAPERIRIQTIHGFCQSVLKRFPFEARVAPHFSIIDEHTSMELLAEARKQLFTTSEANDCATAIESLAVMVSEKTFNSLISEITKKSRSQFAKWFEQESGGIKLLENVYRKTGSDLGQKEEGLFDKYFNYTKEEISLLRSTLPALENGSGKSDRKTFDALRIWLESPPTQEKTSPYINVFLTTEYEPRKILYTASAEKYLPSIKNILTAEQQRIVNFTTALKSLRVAIATGHLIKLAESLLGIYNKLKDMHGYMDYDDIISHTVKLLTNENAAAWVLFKLDGGIDHLLVDEAQDTSPEQWQIVDAITNEFFSGSGASNQDRTLFVVGDGKQSIFSFQGAEPVKFEQMQDMLRKRISNSGKEFRNIQLALSFRSTEPVLAAVDNIFSSDKTRDGLVFSENYIGHSAHRKGMAGRVEIWPLTEIEKTGTLPQWYVTDRQFFTNRPETMLAAQIAMQIREWLDNKRKIISQDRSLQPGDIMILVQRRGRFSSSILRALKQHKIPVAGADRLILTDHIAVSDCIALGNFLLLPQDDLTLAIVLKSPFIGLSEEDLFELAYDRKSQSLWQRLKTNGKYTTAYNFLSGLLTKVDYLPPYELFSYILEKLEGRKKLGSRLGPEIHDPLDEFLSLALQYTEKHASSLQGFLHWLESGVNEIKRDMENINNEVRIMTVHGSKGLQSPIVFLPDTTRLPRHDNGIIWTEEENPLPLWSTDEDITCRNIREKIRLDKEREYRRLFYVAMTRAEDELYICGWKSNRALSEKCWYEMARHAVNEQWQESDGKFILQSEQTSTAKIRNINIRQETNVQLPDWVNRPPAEEPIPSKPLSPSQMEATTGSSSPLHDQSARMRGLLIHRLLQHLPDVAHEDREAVIKRFINHYAQDFTEQEHDRVSNEVIGILNNPDFFPIFSAKDSIAEAPVSGIVYDKDKNPVTISGQIDRLVISGDEVYIIDYKTNLQVPENEKKVPKPYIRQMAAYRELVSAIYPDKIIRCALLFTSAPKLMLLS